MIWTDGNIVTCKRRKNICDWLGNQLHIQFGRGSKGTEIRCAIRIASIKIRSGWTGSLEAALRTLHQGNVGIDVLQETILIKRIHTR